MGLFLLILSILNVMVQQNEKCVSVEKYVMGSIAGYGNTKSLL